MKQVQVKRQRKRREDDEPDRDNFDPDVRRAKDAKKADIRRKKRS